MSENIPFKKGKEDLPKSDLTADELMAEVSKKMEVKKLKGRKHFGRGQSRNSPPEKKAEEALEDYRRFEGEGENW